MLNLYPPSAHDVYKGSKPTIPADIEAAVQAIYKACKGLGTDERLLNTTLGPKTPDQRYLIAYRYKELFKKSLKDLVTSETSGHYGKLLKAIAVPLPEMEADIIRDATRGLGTTEKYLFPVLMGRTNAEMTILKKTYYDIHGQDLGVTLDSELSGDFKKVIMASIQANMVEYSASIHTAKKAEDDAETLYKAGQGRWGTDEETFIRVVTTSPPQHLRNVNAFYSKKYNYTIVKAVEKEFGGDAKKALLFLVRMVLEPLEFLAEHFESTMKGFGTDEEGLTYAIVRYHCVLPQIKEAYKKMYKTELRQRVHGETSGDYRQLLLAVLDAPAH